jgi:tripartite-type tricarboxylate transporter receptor subunit TctC
MQDFIRVTLMCATMVCGGIAPAATAQDYPTRPLRIILPFGTGGGNDAMARLVAGKLSTALQQRVLVDNRPGGGSVIASEAVLQAPADGYTLYLVSSTVAAAPSLQKSLPYDTIRDFAPITRLGVVPGALTVHVSLPARNVREFLALAKARPGEVTFGSGGIGSGGHLAGEIFKYVGKVNVLHVPYKSTGMATQAMLSGEVMAIFSNPLAAIPHVKSGRLRILGVTSAQRWPLLPDYPAIAEAGLPGYEYLIWNGMSVKAGTPQAIVDRLHREVVAAATAPDVVKFLESHGSRPLTQTPAEFGTFIKEQIDLIARVAKAANLRAH